jgi:hypothetical protein
MSGVAATSSYIHRQDTHHKTRTFRDEFQAMLQKHNLGYANRMLD